MGAGTAGPEVTISNPMPCAWAKGLLTRTPIYGLRVVSFLHDHVGLQE